MAEGLVPEVRDALGFSGKLLVADRVGREMDPVAVDVEDSGEDGQRDRPHTAAECREGHCRGGGDGKRRRQVDPVAGRFAGERRHVVKDGEGGREGKECPLLPGGANAHGERRWYPTGSSRPARRRRCRR